MSTREIFLNSLHWSGRLTSEEAAWALGFESHDIPILTREKLLRSLGTPAPNAPKYFSAVEIVKLAQDPQWLSKATKAVSKHWQSKNQRRHVASALISD